MFLLGSSFGKSIRSPHTRRGHIERGLRLFKREDVRPTHAGEIFQGHSKQRVF